MHTEYIEYKEGQTTCEGFLAYDTAIKGKRPAVIVSHAWGGQDDFARGRAIELAKLGYAGFALDLYGKGKRGNNPQENTALMQPFLDDRSLLLKRMNAAVATIKPHLIVDSARIAAMGYCFGGLCVLDLARSGTKDIRGVASFHGILAPPPLGSKTISAKVLTLHGYDDPWVKPDEIDKFAAEMNQAKADWQMHVYGNTVHAFAVHGMNGPEIGAVYSEKAERRSWIELKDFLSEIFA